MTTALEHPESVLKRNTRSQSLTGAGMFRKSICRSISHLSPYPAWVSRSFVEETLGDRDLVLPFVHIQFALLKTFREVHAEECELRLG